MKQMIMHASGEMLQTAVLHDGRLFDYFVERAKGSGLVGNIYKGRVVNVLPGMQAAFVDIGIGKNAFLYIDDLLHPHLEKQPEHKPSIQDIVKAGQELIVQVMKEPLGGKGARVTTHFSLPGRWLVYMPIADYIGVSKKIASEQERIRLRDIGERLRKNEEGFIIRTAAEGENERSIEADVSEQRELWGAIAVKSVHSKAPAVLHYEAGLLRRVIRDNMKPDIDEVWIDDAATHAEAVALLKEMAPSLSERLRLYKLPASKALFDAYRVSEQIDSAFERKISLPSGGYLVWDKTEALTVIDVNTGKFIGTSDLEDTVFQTNMEAAAEIARLLRVRDVGGIVIIDFIDMELEHNRERVLHQLTEGIRPDHTKCTVVGWTRLGLVELTRKKARENSYANIRE
ncbi:Rne/Rng family ribonuclease [Paenibacillus harenae]|uniref:Ribonuclease G n=1 Tax=Paenibacillus harenae TaxID=306543 RepID=A0ABT9TU13_PAEHA|nr:Rne/Rng family ribonuclease [Paenibacillus harenae]MDQ0110840.1 ribonuclease G [Paenibacillus harenae]